MLPPGIGDPVARRLFRHFERGLRGQWVMRTAGVWATFDYPNSDEVDAADVVFIGGHVYEDLDASIEAELVAAGYGDFIV